MATNDQLQKAFRQLDEQIATSVNYSDVVSYLFQHEVLTAADVLTLNETPQPSERMRRLLSVLHARLHHDAFVRLREAIAREPAYKFLVDAVDKRCLGTMPDDRRANGLFIQR
jgi:hypothetical protein